MKSYGITDVGKKRKMNQDYLFFSDQPVGPFSNLYIVADGMGGHKAGDKASSYAVTRFVELARKTEAMHPFQAMESIIKQVNREVYHISMQQEEYQGMGTTFVVATELNQMIYAMNIGDSRLYYYDGATLRQITMDHSLVEELVRAGELAPEESRNHPQKNIITRAIGVYEQLTPDFFKIPIRENQKIILCSDGLSNMVDDEMLCDILSGDDSIEQEVERCRKEALFFGGTDNITVLIARMEDRGCRQ